MKKRIAAAILAMLLALMLAPNLAYAIGSEPSGLTVVMEYGGLPLKGINVAVCQVAVAKEEKNDIIFEATEGFANAGADFTDLTKTKNIALAAVLDAYASANNVAMAAKATDSRGRAAFSGLAAGLYLVAQRDGEGSEYIIAPYLVAVPGLNATGDGWDYNVVSYPKTEPVKRVGELVSVSVFKIWKTFYENPNYVTVQLYRNGIAYGNAVTLNAGTYWRHTWDSLDPRYEWTVDETNVPYGFKKEVTGNAVTGFIIFNTAIQDPPTPPPTPPPAPGIPGTGDAANPLLLITLSIMSAAGLLLLVRRFMAAGRLLGRPRRT